jgi:NADH-quinone oxidoreductase subunit E
MSQRRTPGLGSLRVLPGNPTEIAGMVPESIALRGPSGPEGIEPEEGKSLSRESLREIDRLVALYPDRKSALLPSLWVAQHEQGFVGTKAMEQIAGKIGMSPACVAGVVSFYTMYYTKPVGRHVLQVCTTLSCYLRGADRLVDHIRKKIGVEVGGTTKDGKFTLLTVECLGSCGTAPMLQLNDDFHENLDPIETVDRLLDSLE